MAKQVNGNESTKPKLRSKGDTLKEETCHP
jgi:hypothetical protein